VDRTDELALLLLDLSELLERTEERCRGMVLPLDVRVALGRLRGEAVEASNRARRHLMDADNEEGTP
jgi:hypothetical protein